MRLGLICICRFSSGSLTGYKGYKMKGEQELRAGQKHGKFKERMMRR